MVSAWWLLVVFWLGGVLGLVLGALGGMSRHGDEDQERHSGPSGLPVRGASPRVVA